MARCVAFLASIASKQKHEGDKAITHTPIRRCHGVSRKEPSGDAMSALHKNKGTKKTNIIAK